MVYSRLTTLAGVLALMGLVIAGSAVASGVATSATSATMGMDDARHLLARTGFGPTLNEIKTYAALTREQGVARVLAVVPAIAPAVATSAPPAWVQDALRPPRELRNLSVEDRRAYLQQQLRQSFELRAWWINEMRVTPSPLAERMTLFWHNHFTSSQQKVRYARLMYRQNVLLREHALGNFATLLHAVSKDPAMIIYLDSATNRKDKPNENFAREVMELFTLGEGNYTEADIREAARAFTGWSLEQDTMEFRNRPFLHDSGDKTVLGQRGRFDGDDVLDILLAQPKAAEYIVGKMWREFVSPEPESVEVRRIAATFRDSRYDIRAALRELLLSAAFWKEANRAVLVKSPVEFVVGSLRQFDMSADDVASLAMVMAGLGQNLFAPPNVKGWPGGEAWINSATLLARKQFIERLFRTEESLRPAFASIPMTGAAQRQQRPLLLAGARRAPLNLPLFESQRWFTGFSGERDPAVERVLLAAAPANPVPAELSRREWVRHLAMDPVYQLK